MSDPEEDVKIKHINLEHMELEHINGNTYIKNIFTFNKSLSNIQLPYLIVFFFNELSKEKEDPKIQLQNTNLIIEGIHEVDFLKKIIRKYLAQIAICSVCLSSKSLFIILDQKAHVKCIDCHNSKEILNESFASYIIKNFTRETFGSLEQLISSKNKNLTIFYNPMDDIRKIVRDIIELYALKEIDKEKTNSLIQELITKYPKDKFKIAKLLLLHLIALFDYDILFHENTSLFLKGTMKTQKTQIKFLNFVVSLQVQRKILLEFFYNLYFNEIIDETVFIEWYELVDDKVKETTRPFLTWLCD
jgi:eIF4-gamma/eIF5/eIF2-epsilon./Domain found in IF2B/IF5.